MIKTAARIASALILILLIGITDTYLKQVEEILPMNTDTALILSFKGADLTKEQIIQDLSRIAQDNDLTLIKIVADREDFLNGKDLYTFGSNQEVMPIDWYDQKKHGYLYPADQLAEANLNGVYMLAGSTEGKEKLTRWINDHGIQITILETKKTNILKHTVLGSGYGVALFCAFVLMLITTMGWSANRIHSKSLRILAGQKISRIIAADTLSLIKVIGSSVISVGIAGTIIIIFIRGIEKLTDFGPAFLIAIVVFLIALAASIMYMVIIAIPTAGIIAQRRSGTATYRLTSESIKILAILLTAISLPGLTVSTLASLGVATYSSYWRMLSNDVSLRVLTASEEDYLENEAKLASLVQQADHKNEVLLTYDFSSYSGENYPGGEYDGIILTNTEYLHRVSDHQEAIFKSISVANLSDDFIQNFEKNFQLWCKEKCSLEEIQFKVVDGNATFPAMNGTGNQELEFYNKPLIINVDKVSQNYQDSFIVPLVTTSNILFASSAEVNYLINELDLGSIILSVDRIADVGLQQGQSAHERTITQIIGAFLIVGALIISSAITAHVYTSSICRKLFIQRAFGKSWIFIFQNRFFYEFTVALLCSLTALVYCFSQGIEYFWVSLLTPVLYLIVSLFAHLAVAQKVFQTSIMRKG